MSSVAAPPLLVLLGTTASGKSSVALEIAPVLHAEIISLDSMLLYRGMDIGTDKPKDTRGIPHHLIDLLDPDEDFDLRQYLDRADAAIRAIRSRARVPLVVGGTGLYLMGLLKGVFEGAPRDPELRARLENEPLDKLFARLDAIDPASAARVHPNDRRRIVRALEVYATTGRPLSEQQQQFGGKDRYRAVIVAIDRPREELRARIEKRVDDMFARGLVDEVRGLTLGRTASQAVGYKEILGCLEGRYDMTEARRRIISNTVRLSRRQRTWLKRFELQHTDGDASEILAIFRAALASDDP